MGMSIDAPKVELGEWTVQGRLMSFALGPRASLVGFHHTVISGTATCSPRVVLKATAIGPEPADSPYRWWYVVSSTDFCFKTVTVTDRTFLFFRWPHLLRVRHRAVSRTSSRRMSSILRSFLLSWETLPICLNTTGILHPKALHPFDDHAAESNTYEKLDSRAIFEHPSEHDLGNVHDIRECMNDFFSGFPHLLVRVVLVLH